MIFRAVLHTLTCRFSKYLHGFPPLIWLLGAVAYEFVLCCDREASKAKQWLVPVPTGEAAE